MLPVISYTTGCVSHILLTRVHMSYMKNVRSGINDEQSKFNIYLQWMVKNSLKFTGVEKHSGTPVLQYYNVWILDIVVI